MPLEMGVTPVMKGEFGQLFHFYLDVGNVLVTKEVEFKGVCVSDTPAVDEKTKASDGS